MPGRYNYEAYTDTGDVRRGVVTANDTEHVEAHLSDLQLRPIRISKARTRPGLGLLRRSRYEDLIMFTSSLATMHRAGVPLLRALGIVNVGPTGGSFDVAREQIRSAVQAGHSLSEAMSAQSSVFPEYYVASVAAGEESGRLDRTLDELAEVIEKEMDLNRQVKSAVRYPLIVITIIVAAFFVLMTYVVPSFLDFYSTFGARLPLPTRILIAVSDFITGSWPLLLGIAVVGGVLIRWMLRRPDGRYWFDRRIARLPGLGDIVVKSNVARFAMMFQILFSAGIPVVRCLDLLKSVVRNSVIRREINLLGEHFSRGSRISADADEFELFPTLALNMIAVGMESGAVDTMMEQIGIHYTKEAMYKSRHLTAILEPILTVALGLFVLVIALAIFLPMWSLVQVFRGG
jgi:MSHA biogenesis protein MshG